MFTIGRFAAIIGDEELRDIRKDPAFSRTGTSA
jgi:hypothetical protein